MSDHCIWIDQKTCNIRANYHEFVRKPRPVVAAESGNCPQNTLFCKRRAARCAQVWRAAGGAHGR
jgi:hypothetical protein